MKLGLFYISSLLSVTTILLLTTLTTISKCLKMMQQKRNFVKQNVCNPLFDKTKDIFYKQIYSKPLVRS